jgi:hypothetical protein
VPRRLRRLKVPRVHRAEALSVAAVVVAVEVLAPVAVEEAALPQLLQHRHHDGPTDE